MGVDGKYGRVTTEFGDIGENEPVVVFRAQDKLLPKVMSYYLLFCLKAGSPRRHVNIILDTIERVRQWQADPANFTKVPESTGPAGQRYQTSGAASGLDG
jgi:hypothetical protein